jgi:hypothetical protein
MQHTYIVGKYIIYVYKFKSQVEKLFVVSFSALVRSECKLIIYFQTMHVYIHFWCIDGKYRIYVGEAWKRGK